MPRNVIRLVLLFPQIVSDKHSSLIPCNRVTALKNLLAQSGPQLFDRKSMDQQLESLNRLMRQTKSYELRAGRDLYHDPAVLMQLLQKSEPEKRWPD